MVDGAGEGAAGIGRRELVEVGRDHAPRALDAHLHEERADGEADECR